MIWEPGHVPTVGRARRWETMSTQSAPAPLHLVLGDEELLVERAVRAVVDAARVADPDVEVRRHASPRGSPPRTWPPR